MTAAESPYFVLHWRKNSSAFYSVKLLFLTVEGGSPTPDELVDAGG